MKNLHPVYNSDSGYSAGLVNLRHMLTKLKQIEKQKWIISHGYIIWCDFPVKFLFLVEVKNFLESFY